MKLNSQRRSGLSLIETIIASICLLMVVSLSMPYLIQLRSASRLEECSMRIRTIALAAHNFHDAYRRLPPATIGYDRAVDAEAWATNQDSDMYWKRVQNTSSLGLTMPFVGLNVYYEKVPPIAFDMYTPLVDFPETGKPQFDWQGAITGVDEVHHVSLEQFLCPEDDLSDAKVKAIIATQPCVPNVDDEPAMDAVDLAGDIAVQHWPGEADDGPQYTNYVACLGAYGGRALSEKDEEKKWLGAMSSRKRVTLEHLGDGTSRTFMYGESLGEIVDGERGAAMSWFWGGGARVSGHLQPHQNAHDINDQIKILGNEKYSSGVGFGSKHDGLVTFAFCDASVHRISTDIDLETLYELAGAHDGGTPIDY